MRAYFHALFHRSSSCFWRRIPTKLRDVLPSNTDLESIMNGSTIEAKEDVIEDEEPLVAGSQSEMRFGRLNTRTTTPSRVKPFLGRGLCLLLIQRIRIALLKRTIYHGPTDDSKMINPGLVLSLFRGVFGTVLLLVGLILFRPDIRLAQAFRRKFRVLGEISLFSWIALKFYHYSIATQRFQLVAVLVFGRIMNGYRSTWVMYMSAFILSCLAEVSLAYRSTTNWRLFVSTQPPSQEGEQQEAYRRFLPLLGLVTLFCTAFYLQRLDGVMKKVPSRQQRQDDSTTTTTTITPLQTMVIVRMFQHVIEFLGMITPSSKTLVFDWMQVGRWDMEMAATLVELAWGYLWYDFLWNFGPVAFTMGELVFKHILNDMMLVLIAVVVTGGDSSLGTSSTILPFVWVTFFVVVGCMSFQAIEDDKRQRRRQVRREQFANILQQQQDDGGSSDVIIDSELEVVFESATDSEMSRVSHYSSSAVSESKEVEP